MRWGKLQLNRWRRQPRNRTMTFPPAFAAAAAAAAAAALLPRGTHASLLLLLELRFFRAAAAAATATAAAASVSVCVPHSRSARTISVEEKIPRWAMPLVGQLWQLMQHRSECWLVFPGNCCLGVPRPTWPANVSALLLTGSIDFCSAPRRRRRQDKRLQQQQKELLSMGGVLLLLPWRRRRHRRVEEEEWKHNTQQSCMRAHCLKTDFLRTWLHEFPRRGKPLDDP